MNMKRLLIIKLVVWFGWLSYIALAQLELADAVTGSASFPSVGITSIGNLAVFFTSFLRRRLDLEMGIRDLMATITGPKLEKIPAQENDVEGLAQEKDVEGLAQENDVKGLTTISNKKYIDASVLMLSTDTSNSTIGLFMKYVQNAYDVQSILLQCHRCDLSKRQVHRSHSIQSASASPSINDENGHNCYCIEFMKEEGIKAFLEDRTQNILTEVTDSKWLLPCQQCVQNRCHDLNLRSDLPAVCHALEFESSKLMHAEKPICICIPLNRAPNDDWTKVLIRSFKSKDQQDRGVTVFAADALQSYLDGKEIKGRQEVSFRDALIIVPRLAEILINIALTLWFKIDGFSSSLAARRAVRNNVVESKGVGFPASAFLTHAEIQVNVPKIKSSAQECSASQDKSEADKSSVCQVLSFRCSWSSIGFISIIVGGFNLICSAYWAVFVAFDGSARKWYNIHSTLPSEPRVVVIIVAICVGCFMDCWDFVKEICSKKDKNMSASCREIREILFTEKNLKKSFMRLTVIVIEMVFVAVVAVRLYLNEGIGRWVYSALQLLVWLKWAIGSYLLGVYTPDYAPEYRGEQPQWVDNGTLVYSSAFLLNAVLAGVRADWAGVRPKN